ncbi:Alpha/Beta hydrolase protein [Cadophora sp. MPI-SDFR-AT-0126]|nr:Alpha/Beta hydrolase protein [Leotiomycetes sp. MPI-SDFR-AT-0126]
MNPMTYPINNGNVGIHQLRREVAALQILRPLVPVQKDPIVLVPGFSGWGRPLLGTVNYFGGFEDLPLILSRLGYIVIVARIGPISTNRERACEIFAQLTNVGFPGPGGFDLPGAPATLMPVNFGNAHPSPHPNLLATAQTWRAVLYDPPANGLPANWQWSATNKINFICHSQGGTTIRYLIELLSGTSDPSLPQFLGTFRQNWINSVVTLGTPHKGTTVTDVANDFLPLSNLDLLIDFITSCSFEPRQNRIYDLHLDHWGFARRTTPLETYQAMRARIAPDVIAWWTGRDNGLFDNSLRGVRNLDAFAQATSPHIYYFTMSFCATQPFPNRVFTDRDINEFLALFPAFNPGGIVGKFSTIFKFQQFGTWLGVFPTLRAALTWITDMANRHLQQMGYFSQIPRPGTHIPRPDMLPVIAFPAYAIGERNIPANALPNISSEQFRPNDGIVNTRSMDGPVAGPVNNGSFAAQLAAPGPLPVRGIYWHLGTNSTIDHADQIGVFTNDATKSEVQAMYMLFAELGDRLS